MWTFDAVVAQKTVTDVEKNVSTENGLSEGARFMLQLLFKTPHTIPWTKEKTFDILTYCTQTWLATWTLDNNIQTQCVYGLFSQHENIMDALEGNWMGVTPEVALQRKREIRNDVFKMLCELRWGSLAESYITNQAAKEVVMVLAENKLRTDADLRENLNLITSRVSLYTRPKSNESGWEEKESVYVGTRYITKETYEKLIICRRAEFDDIPEYQEYRNLFCEIEKETRKAFAQTRMHKFIDAIDLQEFKMILKDEFEDPFRPQGWQAEALLSMKRFTTIVASRRCGKTMLGVYLILRQFYLPHQTLIYIVPTLKNEGRSPRKYIMNRIDKDPDVSKNEWDWIIKHNMLKSEIQFLSGERKLGIRSQSANGIVVDEAAYLAKLIYDSVSALIRTTRWWIYTISTVNALTPKNRFYNKLIQGEVEMDMPDSNKYTRRITLWENPFIPDDEKQEIVDDLKDDPVTFGAEWMCNFQESNVFELKGFRQLQYEFVERWFANMRRAKIRADAVGKLDTYDRFYVSYDAAKLKDGPWVSVIWFKQWRCETILTGYMKGLWYLDQVSVLKDVFTYFPREKTLFVLEYNNTGVVIDELLKKENIYAILIWAGGEGNVTRDGRVWKVPKDKMVAALKMVIAQGTFKAPSYQQELRIELESYDDEKPDHRNEGNHYDIIASLRGPIWYAMRMGEFAEVEAVITPPTSEVMTQNGFWQRFPDTTGGTSARFAKHAF